MPNENSMQADLAAILKEADQAFVDGCKARHERGQEKYGELTFLSTDTVEMAMEEVLDLSNYARYTFIKLYLLQRAMAKLSQEHPASEREGWISMKELFNAS